MSDHDRLSSLILEHWSRYHPMMLAELRQQNRLEQTLEETAERFSSLLYELTSVRKMEYHQAWELTINEILMPEESPSTSQNQSPPETSASPTPMESGWAARTKKRKQT